MTTLQTRCGIMDIYSTIEEMDNFTYENCIAWLSFNDPNGCYSIEDQIAEFGEIASLEDMKETILEQSLNA